MNQQMREWIGRDIRQSAFGTMTDFRLFNDMTDMMNGSGGMMGGRTY